MLLSREKGLAHLHLVHQVLLRYFYCIWNTAVLLICISLVKTNHTTLMCSSNTTPCSKHCFHYSTLCNFMLPSPLSLNRNRGLSEGNEISTRYFFNFTLPNLVGYKTRSTTTVGGTKGRSGSNGTSELIF